MKTRNLMMAAVILLAGSITMKSVAQENIKALIKKCENMDVIDANIVRNKNTPTISRQTFFTHTNNDSIPSFTITNKDSIPVLIYKRGPSNSISYTITNPIARNSQAPRSIVNLTLRYTPELEKELVATFRKDQDNAVREVEQKKDGKVTHMLYQFDDSEYSFTIKNDTISIQATEGRQTIIVRPEIVVSRPANSSIDFLKQSQYE